MNIKNILTLKFVGIVASILFVFSIFVFEFSNIYRDNEFSKRLVSRSKLKSKYLLESKVLDSAQLYHLYRLDLNVLPKERLQIYDNTFVLNFSSDSPNQTEITILNILKTKNDQIFINEGSTDYVGFVLNINNNKYFIVASAVDEIGYQKIKNLKYALLLLFAIALIITALTGRYFARQALSPISDLIYQLDQITETSLHKRVNAGNEKDEIATLALRFNKMLERLEASFKLQRLFVANASHEFRTPLTAIKGQIEVLLLHKRSEVDYVNTFKSIIEDINKQIELLNALRDLAQATNENIVVNFEKIPIAELITDSRAELLKNKPKYTINLSFLNFPEDEILLYTNGNFALLKACMINLMDNASKFSTNNSSDLKVKFNDTEIVIEFIDDGSGINSKDMEHIFEPFYRSNNTRHVAGFGIGLSLVKKVIDIHKGKILVQSNLNQGTKVTIILNNLAENT